MAPDAKSYEILSRIVAQAAPWRDVMDLETLGSPAPLTAPAIARKDLTTESAVSLGIKLQSRPDRESKRHLDVFEKLLPLGQRKTEHESGQRRQESILVTGL